MKEFLAKLSKIRGVRWPKKSHIAFFAVFIGGALFTPILPWTSRYNYQPAWEGLEAVEKALDNKAINPDLLRQEREKQGLSSNEIKCMNSRDFLFEVLENHAIINSIVADNFGLRSSSVPAFLVLNTIVLSMFTEGSRLNLDKSLINKVAYNCRNYPGRFISRATLDSARQ